jgi:hypothetical protein
MCYKYHSVVHHLGKLMLLRLFYLFIPLAIADNGQLRFLGLIFFLATRMIMREIMPHSGMARN